MRKLLYSQLFLLRDKNKGFTLLELMLSLAIGSIIIVVLSLILDYAVGGYTKAEEMNTVLLNGRHAIEYIKKEIKSADKIISIDYIEGLSEEYKNNIGFVIFNYNYNNPMEYNYVTFYLEDDKIYRIAANVSTSFLPKHTAFSGYNIVAENVCSMEGTRIDFDNKIVTLNIILNDTNGKEYQFQSNVSIRCKVEN